MLRFIERLSDFCGKLAAVLFFAIGGMITFEVVARYVFLSPTSWSEEISRFAQIWATYLAAGSILRHRQLIRIELLLGRFGPKGRAALDGLTLAFIAVFCCIAIYYGAGIVIESVEVGRATSTMLSVPRWMTESAIPIGFGVLLLQCIAEFARLLAGGDMSRGPKEEIPGGAE